MIHILVGLFARAKYILQTEGLIPLLRRGLAFLTGYIFHYKTYYLVVASLQGQDINPDSIAPDIPNLTYKFVKTNEQAEELTQEFDDFRSYHVNIRQRLDNGAVALCVYAGRELAHIGWLAMSEDAKRTFNPEPYHVDFANREACSGGALTMPGFRRKGLRVYANALKYRFLQDSGIITSRSIIETGNTVSSTMEALFGRRIYAEARYVKFLWWKHRKETPLKQKG